MDKNKVFEILNDWNYWDKPLPEFVIREEYQSKLNAYVKTGETIILKGIRRSGKSTLLINHIHNLIDSGTNKDEILFVNFEDPRFNGNLDAGLLEQIFEVYREFINNETKPHIFLDEVQNVAKWEKWVLTGYELKKAHFYITGSSSKLLSKEFGTALSGRYLDINVFPLSFKEYLLFKNIQSPNKSNLVSQRVNYKKAFNIYNNEGGFPKVSLLDDEIKRSEIIMYYETIILKDIVARHKLKNYANVKKVALFLLSNIGKPINLNNIRASLELSYDLVNKYFEYLKDTFLLFEITQFDYSLKKQFSNRKKVYCIDNGIMANTSFRFSEDYGRYIENTVFIELKRRGHDIYFHIGKKECDFVIKEGLKVVKAIQVCRTLQDKQTEKRELDGVLEAMKTYKLNEGYILTEDEEKIYDNDENYKIIVKPVWKWLLENQ